MSSKRFVIDRETYEMYFKDYLILADDEGNQVCYIVNNNGSIIQLTKTLDGVIYYNEVNNEA